MLVGIYRDIFISGKGRFGWAPLFILFWDPSYFRNEWSWKVDTCYAGRYILVLWLHGKICQLGASGG